MCYKVQTSTDDICSDSKRVDGVNNRNTVLNNLNEFTIYDIAMKAATSMGKGPLGEEKSGRTLEDGKHYWTHIKVMFCTNYVHLKRIAKHILTSKYLSFAFSIGAYEVQ